MAIGHRTLIKAITPIIIVAYFLIGVAMLTNIVSWPEQEGQSFWLLLLYRIWTLLLYGTVTALVSAFLGYLSGNWLTERLNYRYFYNRLQELAPERLEKIYAAITALSDVPAQGFRLGRAGEKSAKSGVQIAVPAAVEGVPWAGRSIALELAGNDLSDVRFEFKDTDREGSVICGERFVHVPVPRHRTTSGRERNLLMPQQWLKQSKTLASLLERSFPHRDPLDALDFLISTFGKPEGSRGRANVAIGLNPQWIQSPEFPTCKECNKRMAHIAELSGAVVGGSSEAALYVFGCVRHPERPRVVVQYG